MDFNRRANRVAAQLVSFLEERMHGPTSHQANEENKGFCHARRGRFDMDCGGKREHGRDAALTRRDFSRLGGSERLCKVESGVAATLCHRAPQKRRSKK
jgi:hypothetical protein